MAERSGGGERALAVMAYLGPLVLVPLLVRGKKRFLGYHARQGMYLFGVFVALLLLLLGILFLVQRFVGDSTKSPIFLFFSVILLLLFIVYGVATLFLAFKTAQGEMPIVPLLGDRAGEQT